MYKLLGFVSLVIVVVCASSMSPAYAVPGFMEMYLKDYYAANPNQDCGLCHQSSSGGGPRNAFGQEFEKSHEITPMLRAQYKENFKYPISKISDGVTIYFSDPYGQQIIIETGGKKIAVDVTKNTIDGKQAGD